MCMHAMHNVQQHFTWGTTARQKLTSALPHKQCQYFYLLMVLCTALAPARAPIHAAVGLSACVPYCASAGAALACWLFWAAVPAHLMLSACVNNMTSKLLGLKRHNFYECPSDFLQGVQGKYLCCAYTMQEIMWQVDISLALHVLAGAAAALLCWMHWLDNVLSYHYSQKWLEQMENSPYYCTFGSMHEWSYQQESLVRH